MSSRDRARRKSEVKEGCIVKSGRCVMVTYKSLCNTDSFFRGADVIADDIGRFACLSDKKYGELLGDQSVFAALRKPYRLDS